MGRDRKKEKREGIHDGTEVFNTCGLRMNADTCWLIMKEKAWTRVTGLKELLQYKEGWKPISGNKISSLTWHVKGIIIGT